MSIVIPVDEFLNTTLTIGTKQFPLEIFNDDLNNFENRLVNWHKQKTIEMSVIINGCALVCEPENKFYINEGDCFIVLPDTLHTVTPIENYVANYITVIFDPIIIWGYEDSLFKTTYDKELIKKNCSILTFKKSDSFSKKVLEDLLWFGNHFRDNDVEINLEITHRLQKLWIEIIKTTKYLNHTAVLKDQSLKIYSMLEYLNMNYSNKFSLSDMASKYNISRGECCRYFKKMMNMTVSDYLVEYRIKKALFLLEDTDMNMAEISYEVGINSTSHFIALFKKKFGLSPLKYRKQNLQN